MSVNTVLTIDALDTDTLGLIIDSGTRGWRDIVDISYDFVSIPTKIAYQLTTNERGYRMRTISCNGSQWGDNLTDLIAKLDELKYRLNQGELQVIFADQPARYYKAYIDGDGVEVKGIHPDMTRIVHEIEISLVCPDPRLYETANQNPTLSGDTTMSLGTAPVGGVFTIPGTTFTLTYKHYDGTTLATLGVTGASNQPITVDMENESIVNNLGNSEVDKITAGDFFLFDPNDGDWTASEFPTVASNIGSTTVLYQKAYL